MGEVIDFVSDNILEPIVDAVSSVPIVGPFILPAAGALLGGPLGAAAASGIQSGVTTGSPLAGFLSAGGSLAGAGLGSALGASSGGFLGDSLPGGFAGNVGSAVGSALGSTLGEGIATGFAPSTADNALAAGGSLAMSPVVQNIFSPARNAQRELPQGLQGFASLTPEQQSTGIATEGVYGGGLAPEERDYYLSEFVNRRLVQPDNTVSESYQFAPIEQSYLSNIGLGGYGSNMDLLRMIQNLGYNQA